MGKQKNTELNFLYMDEKYQEKENKKKTRKPKKTKEKIKGEKTKSRNKGADAVSAQKNNTFNFDNEIVIGVTKIPDKTEEQKKTKSSKKKQSNKTKKSNTSKKEKNNKKIKNKQIEEVKKRKGEKKDNTKKTKKTTKKGRIIKGIIKWTILLSALVASFIYFMMSPLFDLASIKVVNNEKISSDTIISLSELKLGENLYKTSSKQIEKNIKQNPYIESIEVSRQLPNKIEIKVKERKTTYMLEYANSYAYINNQGYILEISEEKLNLPIIVGYTTKQEDIKAGNRLNSEDLEKLAVVLKIMESANSNGVGNLITRINIQNKQNYAIILESENKTAYLGDGSNLSNRMLYLKAILEEERGIEGEIFINGDLNKSDVYFRVKE